MTCFAEDEVAPLDWAATDVSAAGEFAGVMKIPPVVSLHCCRSTESPASFSTSIGTRRCCAANMEFMRGMYWPARSPDTDTTSTRASSTVGVDSPWPRSSVGNDTAAVPEMLVGCCEPSAVIVRLTYESARVSAPATGGSASASTSDVVVAERRAVSRVTIVCSMTAKGRYLFASVGIALSSDVSEADDGVIEGAGYSQCVAPQWAARTATRFS